MILNNLERNEKWGEWGGRRRSWELIEPRGFRTYREAAAIFRLGRAKGVSLTTIDALIAAIALEHRASVFTLDKDFSRIARLTGLPLHPLPIARIQRKRNSSL